MNLLYDAIFTVEVHGGDDEQCSLPRVYELLARDAVGSFAKLQSHQKQAWHCFLAQLGAIATENGSTPKEEEGWRQLLLALATEEAWNMETEDLSKPAFMQAPVPEETLESFTEIHPSAYDVPVLSKSHALKQRRFKQPSPEHWCYLLVNVQTTGFYSPGGRRTSRMNGSYASRPFFGLTPSLRLGPWIMHDIAVLKKHAGAIENRYDFKREVHPLLWTLPWDGESSLEIDQQHPLYIDCARRIRKQGRFMKCSTAAERVTGEVAGQTGDAWAPVNVIDDKVLNPGNSSFEYRGLARILFSPDYRRPISFREVTEGWVVCRAVTGEQGGRVADLQRIIPFSTAESVNPFAAPEESEVAYEAMARVERAGQAADILGTALYLMFKEDREDGEQEKMPKLLEQGYSHHLSSFHGRVDQHFFSRLFAAPQMTDAERRLFWETTLVRALREELEAAREICPSKDRWQRLARAQTYVDEQIKNTFGYASAQEHGEIPQDSAEHTSP